MDKAMEPKNKNTRMPLFRFRTYSTHYSPYCTGESLNLLLILLAFFAVFVVFPAQAQITQTPEHIPAADTPKSPVVVELFSSQACAFCPQADTIMEDMADMENVIALTCHVDYFDVKEGSLAQPFCTDRQTEYVKLFDSGTHYTPQMVVNGHMDVIGYQTEKISAAMIKARAEHVQPIDITKVADGAYQFSLPERDLKGAEVRLWMAVMDAPHNLTVADGANKGKDMTYTNIVSAFEDMGAWDGQPLARAISPIFPENAQSFTIFAQDMRSGEVIAAGKSMR
jgi:hypothetical protein